MALIVKARKIQIGMHHQSIPCHSQAEARGKQTEEGLQSVVKEAASRLRFMEEEVQELSMISRLLSEESNLLAIVAGEKFVSCRDSEDGRGLQSLASLTGHNLDLPARRFLSMLCLAFLDREEETINARDERNSGSTPSLVPVFPMAKSGIGSMMTDVSLGKAMASTAGSAATTQMPSGLGSATSLASKGLIKSQSSLRRAFVSAGGPLARPRTGLPSHASLGSMLSMADATDALNLADENTSDAKGLLWLKGRGLRLGLVPEAVMWAMQSGSQQDLLNAAREVVEQLTGLNTQMRC